MTFHEKLERLLEGHVKAEISRRAGLPANALANMLNSKSLPRIDTVMKIAKALDVAAAWLLDDSRPWPPPTGLLPPAVKVAFRPDTISETSELILAEIFRPLAEVMQEEWDVRMSLQIKATECLIAAGKRRSDQRTVERISKIRAFLIAKQGVYRWEPTTSKVPPIFASMLDDLEWEVDALNDRISELEEERKTLREERDQLYKEVESLKKST